MWLVEVGVVVGDDVFGCCCLVGGWVLWMVEWVGESVCECVFECESVLRCEWVCECFNVCESVLVYECECVLWFEWIDKCVRVCVCL